MTLPRGFGTTPNCIVCGKKTIFVHGRGNHECANSRCRASRKYRQSFMQKLIEILKK